MSWKTVWVIAGAALLAGLPACADSGSSPKIGPQSLEKAMKYAQEAQDAEAEGDHDKAIDLNQKALRLRPEIGGVWNNLGLALMHRGNPMDFVDAVQAFKRAADILPTDHRPYLNLGVLYHERGFDEEALRYFALALERNPNSLESLHGAISAAKLLGRSEEVGLTRINRALMLEGDPKWRQVMELERIRIQEELAERAKPAGT